MITVAFLMGVWVGLCLGLIVGMVYMYAKYEKLLDRANNSHIDTVVKKGRGQWNG